MRKYRCIVLALLGLYLGVYHGQVALLDSASPQPLEVYPYRVESYPPADQLALGNGIPVHNKAHLQKLLEDFTS